MADLNQLADERPAAAGGIPGRFSAAGGLVYLLFAVVLVSAALYLARVVIEPIAFAFFGMALVWPIQKGLERRMPKTIALLLTISLTLIVIFALASAIIWSVGDIVHWILDNLARFQSLYMRTTHWLEGQGIFVTEGIEQYDVRSFASFLRGIALGLNSFAGFSIVVFLLLTFGLTELAHAGTRFHELERKTGWIISQLSEDVAKKIRKYMIIRTIASVATGLAVFIYTRYMGLDLAIAWGVISFVLNYIPYIGTLIAVVLPVLFSAIQFESWQTPVILFGGLYVIQFLISNYLEPIVASKAFAVSPFVMLVAFFFWGFLWGIPGAFIGLPMTIALVTICQHNPSTRWIVRLLSSSK
jgi:predicted PurR-regulated permease PerM